MANNFYAFMQSHDRTLPIPETHIAIEIDTFMIMDSSTSPMMDLSDEWNKVTNLERISWVEDQGYEYEVFMRTTISYINAYVIKMMLLLTKEAATAYLLRWHDEHY